MAEFYKIRRDLVFKTIFGNKKNWDLLKILIEEVIHEEVEMDRIIQINLSVEQKDAPHFPLIGEYTLHDKKLNRDYIDNFKIYEINITEMARLCYNGKKEMCLLGMLDMSQKELENINGDKHMAKLKNEAIKVNNDDEIVKLLSDEDEERLYINTMKAWGKEEGVKEHTIEMVKKMFKENIDISTISRVSGLSKEEIEDIKTNNK